MLNPLFNIRELSLNISFISTPYYDICIDIIRRCKHVKGFPNISSKTIYKQVTGLENKCTAIVEEKFAIFDWKEIWKNLSFTIINSYDRSVIFRYVHEILPNRHRLYTIKKYLQQIVLIVMWRKITCIWFTIVIKLNIYLLGSRNC